MYRCKACGKLHFPRRAVCAAENCVGTEFEPAPFPARGKLVAWTTTNVLPAELNGTTRTFGLVDFGQGVRAVGLVCSEAPLSSGMDVSVVPGQIRGASDSSEPVTGLLFVPAGRE